MMNRDDNRYARLLGDLGVDPAHFPHGTVEEFIDEFLSVYGAHEDSVRPLMESRAMVMARANESFRIAVTGRPEREGENPPNRGCRSIETVAKVGSMQEAVG